MDPVTTALLAAISAGALSGLTEAGKTTVADAYGKLKALLAKKFGGKSDVVQAVEQVEAKPDSAGRKETLAEEVAGVKADQDPEIVQAAQILLQAVQGLPEG
jgi:hypothetical protein